MGQRCSWADSSPVMRQYHDTEWGFITHDERELFELLSLEIMQAGLSWQTVLNKREALKNAFANFDTQRIASFDEADTARLLADTGIIRNRLKIKAIIQNSRIVNQWEQQGQTLDDYLWQFTNHQQLVGNYRTDAEVPSQSELSQKVSREMKKKGFGFTGPTTVYSWLQACGVLNDHMLSCDCFALAQKIPN